MPQRLTKRGEERTPISGDFDVIVCGASFAGLAVARQLAGAEARVLVLDRYEIGERQTSACGIPTEWLRVLGLEDSARQEFGELVVHTPLGTSRYPLPWTFSTFDYRSSASCSGPSPMPNSRPPRSTGEAARPFTPTAATSQRR